MGSQVSPERTYTGRTWAGGPAELPIPCCQGRESTLRQHVVVLDPFFEVQLPSPLGFSRNIAGHDYELADLLGDEEDRVFLWTSLVGL